MKFDRICCLHGIHLPVQFHRDLCVGGSRPNDKDFVFFVISKMYHLTPVIYSAVGSKPIIAADSAVVKHPGKL